MNLEQVTEQAAFEALCTTAPKLVCEIRRLLAMGQNPAQIEEHVVRKFGASDTTLYIRGAAEYLQRCAAHEPEVKPKLTAIEVEADSVEDYLDKHYKPDRFRGRGENYARALIASYEREFAKRGYCFTSHHDSVCGQTIIWYGPKGQTQ